MDVTEPKVTILTQRTIVIPLDAGINHNLKLGFGGTGGVALQGGSRDVDPDDIPRRQVMLFH